MKKSSSYRNPKGYEHFPIEDFAYIIVGRVKTKKGWKIYLHKKNYTLTYKTLVLSIDDENHKWEV